MAQPLEIDPRDTLANAIADVGVWRWWDERYPKSFQLEFGGVQLWSPPQAKGRPPNGQYALRFARLISVSFLTAPRAKVPRNWADALHADRLGPFNVGHDAFALRDPEAARQILAGTRRIETRFGKDPRELNWDKVPAIAAFWAPPVGCIVAARDMKLVSFSGEIPLTEVPAMSRKWWRYWKRYWRRKDSSEALPQDYACEVTIPVKA
jgi:hypothetical protein